ncbi:hypothetical protein [Flavobacterium sp. 3HN19-14]|uniref:hypothetical protein n=1 Tax=Flavobacterium sp. 3HN19-14 TaxID=3448133 RepID=UPI003EDEED43
MMFGLNLQQRAVQFITVNPLLSSGSTVELNHTVFSGTCGALTTLYCSAASTSVATGLTPGNVYYVRVYTKGNAVGQWASFAFCVKSPPPPATNDECITAIPVQVNASGQCQFTTGGNLIGATASTVPNSPPTCTGNANDDVWFSFVAGADQHFINLTDVEGTTTNLNFAVYSGTCGALVKEFCSDPNSLNNSFTGYVVGQTYYLRVWSNAAQSQIVTFNVCIKSVSTCETAEPLCAGGLTQPLIFPNTTGTTGIGQVACLFSAPNPTFYYLQVNETGALTYEIRQSTTTNFTGNGIDVDFAAWGLSRVRKVATRLLLKTVRNV